MILGVTDFKGHRMAILAKIREVTAVVEWDPVMVSAWTFEVEINSFQEALEDLYAGHVEGEGVVTRNRVRSLEPRVMHWEARLKNLAKLCSIP